MKGRPDDWTRVVQRHWKDVTAYVVSGTHPSCVTMAADEVAQIDRVMQHIPMSQVARLKPARHWFMAVVLCPGDELDALVAWAKRNDARRIHFYLHRDAEAACLAPWRDAGLPLNRIEEERFIAYGRMHKVLGLDLSDQEYADFCPTKA